MGKVYSMVIKYLDSKRISLLEADRTLYQGYDGGSGLLTGAYSGGGGGGSSSAGGNATTSASGTGGTSTNSSISGSVVAYAGGGSGGSYSDPVGAAGGAGAGLGALSASGSSSASGENATIANRGSGGGGGGWNGSSGTGAGNGSDGIVILRFTTSGNGYSQSGGTVDSSTVSGQTIITYTATSGTTFTPTSAFDVQYLVVAGGAGGGDRVSGGGGAGGLLTGTGFGVTAQAYTITVGAKGTGGSSNNGGSNGGNSVFSTITSIGGGAGAGWATTTGGSNGGSGGGGMDGESSHTTIGGTGTSSDATPTNVQDNSILVEKDTGRRYWFDLAGDYKVHKFTTTGASTFEVTAGSGDIEYLVVAGGGAGGDDSGGGGGAGGFRTATGYAVTAQNYTVTVGAGSTAVTDNPNIAGGNGDDSSITPTSGTTITSTGGGGGASNSDGQAGVYGNGKHGGSGGGAGGGGTNTGVHVVGSGNTPSTTPSQGNNGGLNVSSGSFPNRGGGGGGGAGVVGSPSTGNNGGVGGDGVSSSISGTATYYAGGGGGSGATSASASGGLGGGGASTTTTAISGSPNTGGGGGASIAGVPSVSGAGGSGIVIIRYLNDGSITATGGDSVTNAPPATWTYENTSLVPTVAGLKLHLDASDSTTITKDSSNLVSAWNDKSGQANHVVQATGSKQPLWVEQVQNTLPTIRFDGTDDFLKITAFTGGALAQPNTVFVVCKMPTASTGWRAVYDGETARHVFYTQANNASNPTCSQMYAGAELGTVVADSTNIFLYTQLWNGASSTLRKSKTQIDSGNAGTTSFDGITLGAGNNGTGNVGNPDICEIIVYDSSLSTSDRDSIEDYLTKKWGV